MNKKGEGFEESKDTFELMISVVFILAMLFLAREYYPVDLYQTQATSDPELTYQLWIERLLNNCFTYQDPQTGRIYPSVLDAIKLDEKNINQCFNDQVPFAGLRITPMNAPEYTLLKTSSQQRTVPVLLYKNQYLQPAQLTLYLPS
ncbi:MAG: hypothetical protein AABX70_02890 [Nanoarchaeota archaeon]